MGSIVHILCLASEETTESCPCAFKPTLDADSQRKAGVFLSSLRVVAHTTSYPCPFVALQGCIGKGISKLEDCQAEAEAGNACSVTPQGAFTATILQRRCRES